MKLLAGDIGGTKTLLRLTRVDGEGGLKTLAEQRYRSADFSDLIQIIETFCAEFNIDSHTITSACFGIAGPVTPSEQGQCSQVTNLPWIVESQSIEQRCGIERVSLINDFAAIGYSLPLLGQDDLFSLHQGEPSPGHNRSVLGAGTGLGVALVAPDGTVTATEGGHVDFAPTDEEQLGLWRHIKLSHPRVTLEHLLSGQGLARIYAYLLEQDTNHESDHELNLLDQSDPAAAISAQAMHHNNELAQHALRLFCSIYGAAAGNLALSTMALGGIYIAGGIAPKILPLLEQDGFMESFLAKEPMQELLKACPVKVITNTQPGLLGALAQARDQTNT